MIVCESVRNLNCSKNSKNLLAEKWAIELRFLADFSLFSNVIGFEFSTQVIHGSLRVRNIPGFACIAKDFVI